MASRAALNDTLIVDNPLHLVAVNPQSLPLDGGLSNQAPGSNLDFLPAI
jgi:hypothetical protein